MIGYVLLFFTLFTNGLYSCVIPNPLSMLQHEGHFTFCDTHKITVYPETDESLELLDTTQQLVPQGNLQIILDETLDLPDEGYTLKVTPTQATLQAKTAQGAFWGVQTLRQLIKEEQKVDCVTICDSPRFSYRGLHLDVARHFFSVSFIKEYIDKMAECKLNRFHWHLTDDQGWRIQIKKYPKLQEIGAFRDETLIGHNNTRPRTFDGTRYGDYYTQEEIKEIVEYARRRYIEVIPEIELPGHNMAALAAYPELGCTGGPYNTATHWGIFDDILCAGNEASFTFLQDVLTEVMELFPSKYIHIGGDEAPKTRWKACPKCQARIKSEGLHDEHHLQSYFVSRIEKFLNAHDRLIIGWDEILEGGLAPNATVMSWRGTAGGIESAKLHHPVIMTPCSHLYLDFYQSKAPSEPLAIGGYLPLEKVYDYEPIPEELSPEEATYILGAQANVWTEYMPSINHVTYMLLPRLYALSEVVWSAKERKNYPDFLERVNKRSNTKK